MTLLEILHLLINTGYRFTVANLYSIRYVRKCTITISLSLVSVLILKLRKFVLRSKCLFVYCAVINFLCSLEKCLSSNRLIYVRKKCIKAGKIAFTGSKYESVRVPKNLMH